MNGDSDLLSRALALPEADRAEMDRRLALGLEPFGREEGWEAAWAEEIERRINAYDRGETKAVPWREAMTARVKGHLESRNER